MLVSYLREPCGHGAVGADPAQFRNDVGIDEEQCPQPLVADALPTTAIGTGTRRAEWKKMKDTSLSK